jgi:SanA protein
MKKKYGYIFLLILSLPVVLLGICNLLIEDTARGKTYSNINDIPRNKVGLVLGTARRLTEGGLNPFYTHRIAATVALYEAGKIQYVLVSGDNGTLYYNEPVSIQKDLVKAGIPRDCIFLDFAGFRTLDSMVRAKTVFGLDSVTVISQEFHNERAIYLAEKKGLVAIGFNAEDLAGGEGQKVRFREYFARVKVFVDLAINTQPRFYGDKINID